MKNLFEMKALISDVVGTELPAEQDQVMDATLSGEGLLVIRMFDKASDVMRSRIALKVRGSKAVEAFTDSPEGAYYQVRIDGGQVPLVFTKENCDLFMAAVDKLLVQS